MNKAIGCVHARLIFVFNQSQRQTRRIAEADIYDPAFVQLDQQGEMVDLRGDAAVKHIGRKHGHIESHFTKQTRQKTVQLVTVSAAPVDDDLLEQRRFIQDDGLVTVNIEILERDSQQMGAIDLAQHTDRRRWSRGS